MLDENEINKKIKALRKFAKENELLISADTLLICALMMDIFDQYLISRGVHLNVR